ncbi:YdcF family protein [Occallatibacter savannae]|uniref:YdcF family protein n=1 Tax=Occallatibacter savannae TaxID=1002691 RepID=UPI000D69A605|nr:YdcF family protein [Occallatibacter savannae]
MSLQGAPAAVETRTSRPFLRWTLIALAIVALAVLIWIRWVYGQIEWYASRDMAVPSDAIAVFGAAEYDGRPSPVFRARLDHAESLYNRGIAPLIVTLGGDGGDHFSEGRVGEEYLVGAGVPDSDIIAETESTSTDESVRRLEVIARTNDLQRIVVVSDATHLFRIHQICAAHGLNVLTSPRPRVPIEGPSGERERIQHEILSYTLWRLHLD